MAADGSPSLVYYEDLPYASRNWDPDWRKTLAEELRPDVRRVDGQAWRTKIAAIGAYESQVRMMWPVIADMEYELRSYAVHAGDGEPAERFWIQERDDHCVAAPGPAEDIRIRGIYERVHDLSPEKRALLSTQLKSKRRRRPD